MKSVCATLFAAVVAALPAPQTDAGNGTVSNPLRFQGLALRSGSPIHFASINANGQEFWIGKETTTYAPEVAGCVENTNQTIFSYVNGQSQLSLSVIVPGGQQVYVTQGNDTAGIQAGQLKFTQAHSVATDGPALYTGFEVVYDAKLQFEGQDWLACPADAASTIYQIWAASRYTGDVAGHGCLSFTWQDQETNTEDAWQYE